MHGTTFVVATRGMPGYADRALTASRWPVLPAVSGRSPAAALCAAPRPAAVHLVASSHRCREKSTFQICELQKVGHRCEEQFSQ